MDKPEWAINTAEELIAGKKPLPLNDVEAALVLIARKEREKSEIAAGQISDLLDALDREHLVRLTGSPVVCKNTLHIGGKEVT